MSQYEPGIEDYEDWIVIQPIFMAIWSIQNNKSQGLSRPGFDVSWVSGVLTFCAMPELSYGLPTVGRYSEWLNRIQARSFELEFQVKDLENHT